MKYETVITDANEGLHSIRAFKSGMRMIDECVEAYSSPRLYHLVFQGAEYVGHKSLLKDLLQRLSRKRIRRSYRAAREVDEVKGDHLHVYLCVESSCNNPDHILNRKSNGWLYIYAKKRGIKVYLNAPRDEMHNARNYISLPVSKPEKIEDAKLWLSYLYKKRSKPSKGQVYSASRFLDPNQEINPRLSEGFFSSAAAETIDSCPF
jgi:hypothetical protein